MSENTQVPPVQPLVCYVDANGRMRCPRLLIAPEESWTAGDACAALQSESPTDPRVLLAVRLVHAVFDADNDPDPTLAWNAEAAVRTLLAAGPNSDLAALQFLVEVDPDYGGDSTSAA